MKHISLLSSCILCLVLLMGKSACAFADEAIDPRPGLHWGMSVGEVLQMERDLGATFYIYRDEILFFNGREVFNNICEIGYSFNENGLHEVIFSFRYEDAQSGEAAIAKQKAWFAEKYGKYAVAHTVPFSERHSPHKEYKTPGARISLDLYPSAKNYLNKAYSSNLRYIEPTGYFGITKTE